MMEVKLVEIRDAGTFIPAMAIRLFANSSEELFLLRRAGYTKEQITGDLSPSYIILCKLDGVEAQYDPFAWPNQRTMGNAHRFLIDHWSDLTSGHIVDVEFILGEVQHPKRSERFNWPL